MRRAALALCLLAHGAAAASDALTRVDGVLATLMARTHARRRLKKEEWYGECGGAANGSLVIVPHVNRRGFIDVMFRYEFAGEIAARVGAQVALPRPCEALASVEINLCVRCSNAR